MKPDSVILDALWQSWFRPASYLERAPVWALGLLLMARVVVAVFPGIPLVLISAMASDSGTALATHGAEVLMYAMFLLVMCAPLLWSWRCAGAGVLIIVSLITIQNLSKGLDARSRDDESLTVMLGIHLVIAVVNVLTLVITEAVAAPLRKTFYFVKWCLQEDDGSMHIDGGSFMPVAQNETEVV